MIKDSIHIDLGILPGILPYSANAYIYTLVHTTAISCDVRRINALRYKKNNQTPSIKIDKI